LQDSVDAPLPGVFDRYNAGDAPDPERHQAGRSKEWSFGLSTRFGTNKHGIVPGIATTPTEAHYSTQIVRRLHRRRRGFQAYRPAGMCRTGKLPCQPVFTATLILARRERF
jgi:hypothetical protein